MSRTSDAVDVVQTTAVYLSRFLLRHDAAYLRANYVHYMVTSKSSSVNLRPLGDKVLIRPLTDEELGSKSPSGIIIPETVDREKADRGEVVAVGPGRWDEDGDKRIPLSVAVGDTVIFQWGDKVEYQGVNYYLVSESNISAVIEE